MPTLQAQQLRWMLLAGATRTVNKDGVHFGGHVYVCPELNGLVGERLDVRYMPHDPRHIELYREGQWLATARPQSQLSAAERERVLDRRAQDAREIAAQARRARRRARVHTGPGALVAAALGHIIDHRPSPRAAHDDAARLGALLAPGDGTEDN